MGSSRHCQERDATSTTIQERVRQSSTKELGDPRAALPDARLIIHAKHSLTHHCTRMPATPLSRSVLLISSRSTSLAAAACLSIYCQAIPTGLTDLNPSRLVRGCCLRAIYRSADGSDPCHSVSPSSSLHLLSDPRYTKSSLFSSHAIMMNGSSAFLEAVKVNRASNIVQSTSPSPLALLTGLPSNR